MFNKILFAAAICTSGLLSASETEEIIVQPTIENVLACEECGCGTNDTHPELLACEECGCGTDEVHSKMLACVECGCGTDEEHPDLLACNEEESSELKNLFV